MPIYNLIKLKSDRIKPALVKLYGPSAEVRWDPAYESWIAETPAFTVEVSPYKGRVLNVLVRFPRPIAFARALTILGLPPRPPTDTAIGAVHWRTSFDHIDEVMAILTPTGSNLTVHVLVTPDKSLFEEWMRQ